MNSSNAPSEPSSDRGSSKRRKNCLWLPDGNLIIQVIGGKRTHLHRVHAGTLTLHSKVFADMVSVPSGCQEDQETVEGCPVVQLHDSPEHVYWLLQVLYLPGILPSEKLRQATFDKLEQIFILADKYGMEGLTDRLLPLLERDWPSSLTTWDANEAEIKLTQEIVQKALEEECDPCDLGRLDDILPEPCRVVSLARRCNFESVLPSLFYQLSRIDVSYDPTPKTCSGYEFLYYGGRSADTDYLASRDWDALYSGMSSINRWCRELLQRFPRLVQYHKRHTHGQPEYEKCSQAVKTIKDDLDRKFFYRPEHRGIDPLAILAGYQKPDLQKGLCYNCGDELKWKLAEERTEFWNELPSFFRLSAWPEQESDEDE